MDMLQCPIVLMTSRAFWVSCSAGSTSQILTRAAYYTASRHTVGEWLSATLAGSWLDGATRH
jgi:hypothetical protein